MPTMRVQPTIRGVGNCGELTVGPMPLFKREDPFCAQPQDIIRHASVPLERFKAPWRMYQDLLARLRVSDD